MESEARLRTEEFQRSVHLLESLGRRATLELLILFCCEEQRLRFNQISRALKHISTKTVAARLKELENDGLVERKAYNEIPPRVEYKLTLKGQELADSLMPLYAWIRKWTAPTDRTEFNPNQEGPQCDCRRS
ncbi:MAG: helix-turn-helix domain-containing protein [Candidatus Bathyarchaeia archaeon]